MNFKEKLKDLRKQSNLSQEELAEKIGVSRQAITKWETGKGLPDIENMKLIAQLFDISIDELVYQETGRMTECSTVSETMYDIEQEYLQFDIDLGTAKSIFIYPSKDEKLHIELLSEELSNLDHLFKVKLDERKGCLDVVCQNKGEISKEVMKTSLSIHVALPSHFTRHCEIAASAVSLKLQDLYLDQFEFDGDAETIQMSQCTGNFDFTGKKDYDMTVDRVNGTITITQWKANCLFHIPATSLFQIKNEGRKCAVFSVHKELEEHKECADLIKLNGYKSELTIDLL